MSCKIDSLKRSKEFLKKNGYIKKGRYPAKTIHTIENILKINAKKILKKVPEAFNYNTFVYLTKYGTVGYNKYMFEMMDRLLKNEDNLTSWYKDILNKRRKDEGHFSPDFWEDPNIDYDSTRLKFENEIKYTSDLIYRVQKRLNQINSMKKEHATNHELMKKLIKQEHELELRLNGDEELGIKGLQTRLAEFKSNPTFEKLKYYTEQELERVRTLVNSNNPDDVREAEIIIDHYNKMATFNPAERHPLFENEDIYDSQGNLVLDEDVVKMFKELQTEFEKEKGKIEIREKKTLTDVINTSPSFKRTFGEFKEMSYDEAFHTEKGLKDISLADMFTMDITNGIFSHNGIVPQVMFEILTNNINLKLAKAIKVKQQIEELQNDLEKVLNDKGFGINRFGMKGVSYEIFRATTEDGLKKDSVVQRFSDKFTKLFRNHNSSFYSELQSMRKIEDKNERLKKIRDLYIKKRNWLKKHTFVIDYTRIPEIINDKEFEKYKKNFDYKNANKYKQFLINEIGENAYNEIVEESKKKLKEYTVKRQLLLEGALEEENVKSFDELKGFTKRKLNAWINSNNPFIATKNYHSNTPITTDSIKSTMLYNHIIPRKYEVNMRMTENGLEPVKTNIETGYYDKNFEIIESDETLKKFHDILKDSHQLIFNNLPPELQKLFWNISFPTLEKSLMEILFDPDTSFLRGAINAFKELWERIKRSFGEVIQGDLSRDLIDPITGKIEPKVNAQFLKSNKKTIDDRYFVELQSLKKVLGLKVTDKLRVGDKYDIKGNQAVIEMIAKYLGVESSISAIKRKLPSLNFDEPIAIAKLLKDLITHQVVTEQSWDLPKIVKTFVGLTMEYSARQEALPMIQLLKKHYEQIKNPKRNNTGKVMESVYNGETIVEGYRKNAIKQVEDWFQRSVLGNYGSVNEFGDTRLKRGIKNIMKIKRKGEEDDNDEEKQLSEEILNPKPVGQITTKKEKIFLGKLTEAERFVRDYYSDLSQSPAEDPVALEEMQEADRILNRIKNIRNNVGREITATAIFDNFFNFLRLKGLGWNLSAGITNVAEGQIANAIAAASGDFFEPNSLYKANHIVKGSFLKYMTGNKVTTKNAWLARVLMDRFSVLQDASNELQKATTKTTFDKFSALNPYEITRRGEYLNQAPLMIAMLMETKIKNANGTKESSVWDAFDNETGKLKQEFRTEENIKNWEEATGEQYNNFKTKLQKTIVQIHGDYDQFRGNMASKFVMGKALLFFKRWMARQFYQRFAVEQADLELGLQNFKGRYTSHSAASATLHGAIIGFGGLSVFGMGAVGLVAGGIGMGLIGHFFGVDTETSYIKELASTTKGVFLNMIGLPLNNLAGKEVIKQPKLNIEGKVNQRDFRNYRANMTEMSIMLMMLGLTMFAKGLANSGIGTTDSDDDDDIEDAMFARGMINLLVNKSMQLSSQAGMYASPPEMYRSTIGDIAPIKFFSDVNQVLIAAKKYTEGEDILLTGPDAGKSRLWKRTKRAFLPAPFKAAFGFGSQMSHQFRESPFDNFMFDDGGIKDAKRIIRVEKLKEIQKIKQSDISHDEKEKAIKKINKKYRKGRKETYDDVLKRIGKKE